MSSQELRTAVVESGSMIPLRHRRMLVNVLDLEDATVEDIMIPRNEIVGIDLDDDWEDVLKQITHSNFTRLPVFTESMDDVAGILHVKKILRALSRDQLDKDTLKANLREMYYVPEHTPLMEQLVQFQEQKRRIALVVDEYGDIQGLITLEDLLEEIVGEFTTDTLDDHDIKKQPDGSWLIDASATIRDLNRELNWNLPTDGPKTLNGLLLEQLEAIPEAGTSVKLGDLAMTVVQTRDNAVRTVAVRPVGSGSPAS
jgi:Mg2+/Co2+ transporter CorB